MSAVLPILLLLAAPLASFASPRPHVARTPSHHATSSVRLSQAWRDEVEHLSPGDEIDFVDPDTGARKYGTLQSVDEDSKTLEIRDDATSETDEVDPDDVLDFDAR